MAAKHHRHIALTEPHNKFVERQIAGGRYPSACEVVRAGLGLLIDCEEPDARLMGEDNRTHG